MADAEIGMVVIDQLAQFTGIRAAAASTGSPGLGRTGRCAALRNPDGMVGGDLLDRLAATDRLYGDPGLELGTVGAALAYLWEPLSGAVPRLRG